MSFKSIKEAQDFASKRRLILYLRYYTKHMSKDKAMKNEAFKEN